MTEESLSRSDSIYCPFTCPCNRSLNALARVIEPHPPLVSTPIPPFHVPFLTFPHPPHLPPLLSTLDSLSVFSYRFAPAENSSSNLSHGPRTRRRKSSRPKSPKTLETFSLDPTVFGLTCYRKKLDSKASGSWVTAKTRTKDFNGACYC